MADLRLQGGSRFTDDGALFEGTPGVRCEHVSSLRELREKAFDDLLDPA
jgi:hypothetical protein